MALVLMSKWKSQNGLCALSGRKLDRQAHIDHILPVSRGGTNEASNLQWLDPMINQAKSNMTDQEFLDMCKQVINWASKDQGHPVRILFAPPVRSRAVDDPGSFLRT